MSRIVTVFIFGLIMAVHSMTYAQEWQYEVKPGDSLWSIAESYMISELYYLDLQALNKVKYPRRMQPGRIIRAPVEWLGNFPGSARIVTTVGKVDIVRLDTASPVEAGELLGDGDALVTGEDGAAVVEFSDSSIVRVSADTWLKFSSLKQSYDGSVINARLTIESGRAHIHSNPDKRRGHRLEIKSPAAVTAVRGTEFRVGVNLDSGDTASEVLVGRVGVDGTGKSVIVNQLQGTVTAIDKAPIAPVNLLPGPSIHESDVIESTRGGVSWTRLAKASAYRIRASPDENFHTIIYDQVVAEEGIYDIYFPEDGEFYLSVRAADANNIEGLDSVVKISVNARPEPPLIILPRHEAVVFDASPEFSWTLPVEQVSKMHFQLATDNDLKNVLVDRIIDVTDHLSLEQELSPGDYYWRVANIDEQGHGPATDPMQLSIKAQPELVPEMMKTDSGSFVKIRLERDESIPAYHVQVARDAGFTKIIFDQWVEEDSFTFKTKTAGAYFIRLGIKDLQSNMIQYSDSQKIIVPYKGWKGAVLVFLPALLFIL